jgi:hypothetical protein
MDPVVHMMFKAMSARLHEVNNKINDISERIIRDLACRVFFDGLLHPIPASTILKFTTGSSQTTIDTLTEACWINTSVQPSVTYYFLPAEQKELYPIEAVVALAATGEGGQILWIDPQWDGKNDFMRGFDNTSATGENERKDQIYIGIRPAGLEPEIPASDLMIMASRELLGLLNWCRWRFTGEDGYFGEPITPGKTRLQNIKLSHAAPEISLWGHDYYPHEHLEEYREYFFHINDGVAGRPPLELREALPGVTEEIWAGLEPLYWIQIESDSRFSPSVLKNLDLVATNCVVALNAHFQKQSFFYHGPGPMTLELQPPAGEIYEIISITDNHGREYGNVYAAPGGGELQYAYVPRIEGDRLSLVIIPAATGSAPDRFSIEFKTTAGEAASGISAGLLNSLYNPHPGIESVVNLTTSRGGVDARTFEDMIDAFPNVLRSNNRAIVITDFEALAMAFDIRVKSARARLGSVRRNGAMQRCIEITVDLGGHRFEPKGEADIFLARLEKYLEKRGPMGTIVAAKLA